MSWWIWRRRPDRKSWSLISVDVSGCLIIGMLLLVAVLGFLGAISKLRHLTPM